VQVMIQIKFNFNNFARVCNSLAACQRHTPSSLAANNDEWKPRFRRQRMRFVPLPISSDKYLYSVVPGRWNSLNSTGLARPPSSARHRSQLLGADKSRRPPPYCRQSTPTPSYWISGFGRRWRRHAARFDVIMICDESSC